MGGGRKDAGRKAEETHVAIERMLAHQACGYAGRSGIGASQLLTERKGEEVSQAQGKKEGENGRELKKCAPPVR
jgi:hypothetical protein